jgi:hypothetical protein
VTEKRNNVAGEDTGTPAVYVLEDGSRVLVYSSASDWPHEGLFEYRLGDAEPRLLYVTGHDVDDYPHARILVGVDDLGGINIRGWAPMFPYGRPYLLEPDATAAAGVPRLLVNLTDGTVAIAPPIQEPIEVSLPTVH